MLLFSLQLIQERLRQVCLCTLLSHVKSTDYLLTTGFQILSLFNQFFSLTGFQWFLNDLSNLREISSKVKPENTRAYIFFSLTTKFSVHFVFKSSGHL